MELTGAGSDDHFFLPVSTATKYDDHVSDTSPKPRNMRTLTDDDNDDRQNERNYHAPSEKDGLDADEISGSARPANHFLSCHHIAFLSLRDDV